MSIRKKELDAETQRKQLQVSALTLRLLRVSAVNCFSHTLKREWL